nr:cell division protein [Bifidobacterium dolichotidis]
MEDLPDLQEHGNDEIMQSRQEFTTVYDVIDQIETQLQDAKGAMFQPSMVKVDRNDILDQLEQLKTMLPVQLERASALMRESEHRLEAAQTQANVIVTSAQSRAADMVREAGEQAQYLAGQENVTEIARQKARQIIEQAQQKADHLTQGADRYSLRVMEELQQQLNKASHDVTNGIRVLEERQRQAQDDLNAENGEAVEDDEDRDE